jgi:hypothetical protein
MRPGPLALAGCLLSLLTAARADEGMWLFNAPPRERIQASYGYQLEDAWLSRLMKASVRFNSGGSGAFVSGDGLVITNHHVGLDALQKMSTPAKNFVRDGYYADTPQDEVACLDLELDVLQSIEDVTGRVNAGVSPGATGETAAAGRRKVVAAIEKESHDATGLRSDVVTLYQGGLYQLYRYRRYTDVRLVFSPEQQAAFFGGAPDNFEYPRYDLDICLFRVYEEGRPVRPENFLKWSARGAKDGDLVFMSGNPGSTDRMLTVPELEFRRDTALPLLVELLKRRDVLLTSWGARDEESERRTRGVLFNLRNAGKLDDGLLAELQNPVFMGAKRTAEDGLQGRPGGAEALVAYKRIAAATAAMAATHSRLKYLENAYGFYADSFIFARTLLRSCDERAKPDGERLPEFTESRKETLELALLSEKPVYPDLEILQLGDSLTSLTEALGYADPTVQAILGGMSPRSRSAQLVLGTRVREVAFRRQLYAGGAPAVRAARDPMIEVARLIDSESRGLRAAYEAQEEVVQEAHATIDPTPPSRCASRTARSGDTRRTAPWWRP